MEKHIIHGVVAEEIKGPDLTIIEGYTKHDAAKILWRIGFNPSCTPAVIHF